jgi:hypothetical protein
LPIGDKPPRGSSVPVYTRKAAIGFDLSGVQQRK